MGAWYVLLNTSVISYNAQSIIAVVSIIEGSIIEINSQREITVGTKNRYGQLAILYNIDLLLCFDDSCLLSTFKAIPGSTGGILNH